MLQGSEQKTQESSTSIAVEHDSLQKMKMHTHCTVIISTVLADCQMSTTFCLPHLKSSKLSSLASPGMMLLGLEPRTANLVAPCCLSTPNTSPSRSATRPTIHLGSRRILGPRDNISLLRPNCDEQGDGLRAALSYLINQSTLPKFDLRQLPGPLARSILITNPP